MDAGAASDFQRTQLAQDRAADEWGRKCFLPQLPRMLENLSQGHLGNHIGYIAARTDVRAAAEGGLETVVALNDISVRVRKRAGVTVAHRPKHHHRRVYRNLDPAELQFLPGDLEGDGQRR